MTSSTENLIESQPKKERSSSQSKEKSRLLTTNSGSLDDIKQPAYQAFQSHHTGMKYVGHWLKRLRLHKYYKYFENTSFEEMMTVINETYLERLNITQGARTKMVNSIQKLKERHANLMQAEVDLKSGNTTINAVIQLLTELAETPMKPIDRFDPSNVAAQFLNVLSIGMYQKEKKNRNNRSTSTKFTYLFLNFFFTVCNMMRNKMIGPLDEELIDKLIEIFNIIQLGNTEPFQTHANQLKEMRFEVDAIKRQFPQRNYARNGNGLTNGNTNKTR